MFGEKQKLVISNVETKIDNVFSQALNIFEQKMANYGSAWLGLSYLGFADQIFIKAYRYKILMHTRKRKITDPPELELFAIINYCVLFLIARNKKTLADIFNSPVAMFESPSQSDRKKLLRHYRSEIRKALTLQKKKDHDYGSAWQGLSIEGLADIIFSKIVRMKQMLSAGKTPLDDKDTDGIAATLRDLINYSAFALVLMESK
jgi:hypothetical protein